MHCWFIFGYKVCLVIDGHVFIKRATGGGLIPQLAWRRTHEPEQIGSVPCLWQIGEVFRDCGALGGDAFVAEYRIEAGTDTAEYCLIIIDDFAVGIEVKLRFFRGTRRLHLGLHHAFECSVYAFGEFFVVIAGVEN